jgi:hypothetical protein
MINDDDDDDDDDDNFLKSLALSKFKLASDMTEAYRLPHKFIIVYSLIF